MTLRCVDPACLDGPPLDGDPAPRIAATGLLCQRCADLLERRLAELPALDADLAAALTPTRGGRPEGGRTKGSPPVPINVAAHDHRQRLAGVLMSWVQLVAEERSLRGPDRTAVDRLAPWLVAQADWIVDQPWVDDLCAEVADLVRAGEGIVQRWRRPSRAGANCFDCDGPLIRRVVDGLEEDTLTCYGCGRRYDDAQYLLALRSAARDAARAEIDGELWATPELLAHDLGRSVNSLKAWRRDGLVRARRLSGVTFLSVDDVEREHGERSTRRSA